MSTFSFKYDDAGKVVAVEIDGELHELGSLDPTTVPGQDVMIRDVQTSIRSTFEQMRDSYDGGSIIVGVEATHGGYTNRNRYHYLTKGMKKYVDTWTKPFGKPYLVNHDSYGSPNGRVKAAKFVSTGKTTGYHDLQVQVSGADEIARILDLRALTVSVGSHPVDTVECSFCQHDLFHDGRTPGKKKLEKAPKDAWLQAPAPGIFGEFGMTNGDMWRWDPEEKTVMCPHIRGLEAPNASNAEDGKIFWYNHGQAYDEISRVNMPADINEATGEFAHIREVLEQTDGLETDVAERLITETLSRIPSGAIDRSRFQIVSEKDLYRPTTPAEAIALAHRSGFKAMFDTGLWLAVQATHTKATPDEQVMAYFQNGGTFVYPLATLSPQDAMALTPAAFGTWLRAQSDMDASERAVLDRIYTNAYIRKHQ